MAPDFPRKAETCYAVSHPALKMDTWSLQSAEILRQATKQGLAARAIFLGRWLEGGVAKRDQPIPRRFAFSAELQCGNPAFSGRPSSLCKVWRGEVLPENATRGCLYGEKPKGRSVVPDSSA